MGRKSNAGQLQVEEKLRNSGMAHLLPAKLLSCCLLTVMLLSGCAPLFAQRQPPPIRWEDWGKEPLPDVYWRSHLKIQVVGAPPNSLFVVEDPKAMVAKDTSKLRVSFTLQPTDSGITHWITLDMDETHDQPCSGDTTIVQIAALDLGNDSQQAVAMASVKVIDHYYLSGGYLTKEIYIWPIPPDSGSTDTLYRLHPVLAADSVLPLGVAAPYRFKPCWHGSLHSEDGEISVKLESFNDCHAYPYDSHKRIPCKPQAVSGELLWQKRYLHISIHPSLTYYPSPCPQTWIDVNKEGCEFWYDWHTRQVVER
jgi:hypothetical protein